MSGNLPDPTVPEPTLFPYIWISICYGPNDHGSTRTRTIMPSYDFACRNCGAAYEKRLSMSAYSAREGWECPECGSDDVERRYTAVNVIAGSGGGRGPDASCRPGSGFT